MKPLVLLARENYFFCSSICFLPSRLTSLFCARFLSRRCFHHSTVLTEPFDLLEEATTFFFVRFFFAILEGKARGRHRMTGKVAHVKRILRELFFVTFHAIAWWIGMRVRAGIPISLHTAAKSLPCKMRRPFFVSKRLPLRFHWMW